MNKIILLIVLVLEFFNSYGQDLNSTKLKFNRDDNNRTFSFLMQRNKTILSVSIGNSRPLKVLLDSGMSFDGLLIYNPDLADSIKLVNAKDIQVAGAGNGNPSTGKMADSMSFILGDIEFNNQKVLLLTNDIYKGFPSDGVIGYSILGHYAVEINYDNNTITLHAPENFKADSSWEIIPLEFKENNIPWVKASVAIGNEEPVEMSLYIDYASGEAIEMLLSPEMKYKLPEETTEYHLGRGLSGDIYGKKGKVSKVILGKYELKNVTVAFAPSEVRSKQNGADGIFGNNFFRRFNVIFNYADKSLYIKPNTHFNDPFD